MPNDDVLSPTMPNSNNAQFEEWKIYFEKLIPFFGDDVRLVGHSLGAMFLAKYLNDNPLKRPVRQLILIAGGYDDDSCRRPWKFSRYTLLRTCPRAHKRSICFIARMILSFHLANLLNFTADLPDATSHVFEDRGHFLDAEFPELLELLKQK